MQSQNLVVYNLNNQTGVDLIPQINFQKIPTINGSGILAYDASGNIYAQSYQIGNNVVTENTTGRILSLQDSSKYIRLAATGTVSITVPRSQDVNFQTGTEIYFRVATGSSTISLISGAGVIINGNSSASIGLNGNFALKKISSNTWDFI